MSSNEATPQHSGTALIVRAGAVGITRAKFALVLDVEFVAEIADPWTHVNPPGSPGGCLLAPAPDNMGASVRCDRGGKFLLASLDLLLRSRRVRQLSLGDDLPKAFVTSLGQFAETHGYAIVHEVANQPPNNVALPPLAIPLEVRISAPTAALVLIDVQNDFCASNGATGRLATSMAMIGIAVDQIKRLLQAARDAGLFIVHVRAEYGPLFRAAGSPYRFPKRDSREPAVWTASAADGPPADAFPTTIAEVCLPGSWGSAFVDGIEPRNDEAVISKHRFSAFADTGLDHLLRARAINTIILAGVTTNCCVETTAREAVMRDFQVVIASDCVAVKDHLKDLHDASLESLGLYFGLVRPSQDLIAIWQKKSDPIATVQP